LRQLTRDKSLVPRRSEIRGNMGDLSKGFFKYDICQFESSHPSQPVPSLRAVSGSQKYLRHFRGLAGGQRVSGPYLAPFQLCHSRILAASLRSRFFNIRICLEETGFESAETGSHVRFREQSRCREFQSLPQLLTQSGHSAPHSITSSAQSAPSQTLLIQIDQFERTTPVWGGDYFPKSADHKT
jgi:hypothetical protein